MTETRPPLTYQQLRYVQVFVFLAKRGAEGASVRELAAVIGKDHRSAAVRNCLREMEQLRYLYKRVQHSAARKPYRYWTWEEAWQAKGAGK